MKINTLILSAGRRVELVKLFKEALVKLKIEGSVIGVDIDETAPALNYVDKYKIISRIDSPSYIDEIIKICNEENISLIIPTIDTELLKLSKNKEIIESRTNAIINISSTDVIEICRDKFKTQEFFEKNNFGVPKLIKEKDIETQNYKFPLFIKPLNGSSSINTFKINNEKELNFFKEYVPDPLIQEMVFGDEYTVDVFCDFESNPITIVPRKRLYVRGGEISKGLIIKDYIIINDIKKLLKVLRPKGHITIQCIKTKEGIKYLEINPRFGGGAPMSIKSGANSCENLYKIILGEKLFYNEEYLDNLYCLRFDETVFVKENKRVIL